MGIFSGMLSIASANSSSCKDVEFSNGVTACVNLENVWTDRRELTTDIDWGTTSYLRCDLMTPDSQLRSIASCNATFSYDEQKIGRIKLWIRYNEIAPSDWEGKPSSNSDRTFPQWVYDFDNEERASDDLQDTSNGDLDNFYVTADDTTPSTSQRVDLTVRARDNDNTTITDYTDTIDFKVYYRASSSSSRTQTTSSTYYEIDSDYEDGYDFTSSDDGIAELTNFIKFKKNNYDYKVRVYADDDSSIYKEITFNVGSSSSSTSNGDLDNFAVTADDTTPSTSQRIDLTVRARDEDNAIITDYTDSINFKVYYRASSSSSRTQTTSSTYYEIDSDYDNGYDFTSSDDGIADLTDFIKFKKNNYDYKVRVYAEDDSTIYKEITFNIGSSSSTSNGDLDNFYVTADDTSPTKSQYIDLTVKARDSDNATITDYTDSINFKVYYRASSSSSWVQTTSSTYYTMNSSYTDGYDFSSSNNGQKTFTNFIKFNKDDYDYKVRVYAEDDTSIYKEITFNVGTSNTTSNGDLDNLYVTADDTTPSILQRVDLTIKARDNDNATIIDYNDTVKFKVYYRSSESSSWILTTSSTYYTMSSIYTNGYTFTSSDDGVAGLTNFIEFNKNNYDYKVRVYAENDSTIYKEIIFNVGNNSNTTSNGDLDNFYVTADDTTPTTSQRVDLTVRARDNDNATITDYRDSINFKVYYRTSSSSSWVQTTSSTYYEMDSDYTNGYDFTSSDDGIAELTNFIKFKKNNYGYKVRVYAEDNNSIYKEITFNVGSSSSSTSNGDLDNFYVTTDDTTPSTSQYVDLTVKARDSDNATITDYTDAINFKVYYRASSSSSWTLTTSSTYYTMNSNYTNGYDFTSSNNGQKTFTDFIKFNKNNYEYKVRVYAEDDSTIYKEITFNVGSSSSSSNYNTDNFYVTTDDSSPSTSQWVDLTVRARDGTSTDTTYRGTVQFEVYYRASSSSSWTLTTSTSYYEIKSAYADGYTFTSSNNGQKTFTDIIRFKKNDYSYKVLVYDEDEESVEGYKIFDVGGTSNSSNVDGFSSSELATVENIYDAWDEMISNLESTYSALRTNTRRQNMVDDLKTAMEEIIDDDSNKTYDNFDDFYNAWLDRYRYTISVR